MPYRHPMTRSKERQTAANALPPTRVSLAAGLSVSVIVTTYNRPDALERVLDSLFRQTRLPDEVLVADDGSSDATRQMVSGMVRRRPRFRLVHVWQPDNGFRAARIRNQAIAAARGTYLILLDGDCIPDLRFVEDHLSLAEPGHFFQGRRVLVGKSLSREFGTAELASPMSLLIHFLTGRLGNAHHLVRLPFFPCKRNRSLSGIKTCNMGMFRKDAVVVNGFNPSFKGWGREDSEFAARLFRYGLWRKDHPFLAVCCHLWHRENSRGGLARNDRLLARTLASDRFVCDDGVNRPRPDTVTTVISDPQADPHP